MESTRVYTPLGFIACPLNQCTGHTMNLGRVYTPLGLIVCPLAQCRVHTMLSPGLTPP